MSLIRSLRCVTLHLPLSPPGLSFPILSTARDLSKKRHQRVSQSPLQTLLSSLGVRPRWALMSGDQPRVHSPGRAEVTEEVELFLEGKKPPPPPITTEHQT